jgi:hypothetical protein
MTAGITIGQINGVSGSWDGQARTVLNEMTVKGHLWLVPTNAIQPVPGGIISFWRM